jgi:hypothetical protein
MNGIGLTPAWYEKELSPHALQHKLWCTKARFVAAACGRGSGKTLLSRRRVVRYLPVKKQWHDPLYFYALPTRDQAKRVAWNKIRALIPDNWIAKNGLALSDMSIKTVFGSQLWVVGMDVPARIEGLQWDGGVLDESCDHKDGAFDLSVRPALGERHGWCFRIGVPKRSGPGAMDFKRAWDLWGRQNDGIHESYTWPSSDIMSPEEIAAARSTMDEKDFEEQFGANWQDTSGLIHYAFDDRPWELGGHVDDSITVDPNKRILVGSDFNVDPMAWCLSQGELENKLKGVKRDLRTFDMIWKRNTNTQATLDELFTRYGQHPGGWIFFGDASGRARKTSASSSDYAQILNDKRFKNAQVMYPKANPPTANRFAACNAAFKTADGQRHYRVHPRCTWLIKDLQSRAYKKESREPNDSGDIGHASDGLGYVIHYLWPVVVESGEDRGGISTSYEGAA